MSVASVTTASTTAATSNSSSAASRMPTQTLDQQDFLQLLVTQMTNQDPMNPQKDTEFIGQMAQFTSLEQTKTMQTDIAGLRSDQSVLQATSLIGKTVTLQTDSSSTTQGVVSAVQIQAGMPKLLVNDQAYSLSQLTSVTPTSTQN